MRDLRCHLLTLCGNKVIRWRGGREETGSRARESRWAADDLYVLGRRGVSASTSTSRSVSSPRNKGQMLEKFGSIKGVWYVDI